MMLHLSDKLGIPFKQVFTEEELLDYLKEVYHA